MELQLRQLVSGSTCSWFPVRRSRDSPSNSALHRHYQSQRASQHLLENLLVDSDVIPVGAGRLHRVKAARSSKSTSVCWKEEVVDVTVGLLRRKRTKYIWCGSTTLKKIKRYIQHTCNYHMHQINNYILSKRFLSGIRTIDDMVWLHCRTLRVYKASYTIKHQTASEQLAASCVSN